jgi:predicted transcriptional regulator
MAQAWAAQAARDATVLPETGFAAALAEIGPDPTQIAARFGCDVLAVFRRIALRPGAVAGLVMCDGSGTLTFRKPIPGFALPRFGAACPLWPLFSALARPASPIECVIETAGPQAQRFVVRAYCQPRFPGGFRGPELREAAMLILPAPPAAPGQEVLAIGSSCRVCQRSACAARREPSILTA